MARDSALELLRRDLGPGEYEEIRELWKRHSLAEKARDIEGILSTLTEDCVYELPATRHVWRGLDGAASFYGELLALFRTRTSRSPTSSSGRRESARRRR